MIRLSGSWMNFGWQHTLFLDCIDFDRFEITIDSVLHDLHFAWNIKTNDSTRVYDSEFCMALIKSGFSRSVKNAINLSWNTGAIQIHRVNVHGNVISSGGAVENCQNKKEM